MGFGVGGWFLALEDSGISLLWVLWLEENMVSERLGITMIKFWLWFFVKLLVVLGSVWRMGVER
jgi:heme/copper-type cytochrome/quinol oxidase subunit 4